MKNGITRENFNLKDLKLSKGGGIESTSIIEMNIDGSFMEIERKQKTPIVPHPDLENKVRDLKEELLISTRFMSMRSILNKPGFNPRKDQRELVDKAVDILKEKTTVIGVHVSGEDQNRGVIISGKIQAENGSNIAINSPRMRFNSAVYGFEEELDSKIGMIEDELYLYLHEDKKAQMDAFDEEV